MEAVFFLLFRGARKVAGFKITVPSPAPSYGSLPKVKLEKVFPFVRMLSRPVSIPWTCGISDAEASRVLHGVSESGPKVRSF